MNHVIFYSGGLGSWATAKRVADKQGIDNLYLLFTDTLIEDDDLYRFIIETSGLIFNKDVKTLIELTNQIPETSHKEMNNRKKYLDCLSKEVNKVIPHLIWLNNGKDVWDVFKEQRYLGNSRLAHCSHVLKQDMSRDYIVDNFSEDDTTLYLGIDWTEKHRTKAPKKNWQPYTVEFPMCEEPFVTNIDHIKELEVKNLEVPVLYDLGFSHNNCGGFCVRGGQGHFANLLKQRPILYKYHEEKESEMIEYLGRDVSILRKQINGKRENYTLKQLREDYENRPQQIDMFDIGGCGCFVDDQ